LAEKLNSSISSADQLLRSLLNISKLDAGGITPEFSEFPLSEVFQSLEATAAATASHKGLRMSFAPTSVSVRSDKGLLTSALQNLVANAIRYTERGGVVVGARRQGDKIRIDVIDTGPGIPDAKRDEIFVEFKRLDTSTGTRGAGLGLATVDRITRLLSTRVELDTEPGVGSRFSISVPRAEAQRSTAGSTFSEIKLSKQTSPLISQSVLCIDNDERALDGMKNLFERWGMSVHGFTSDDAALQSFTDNRPPDILLLDYQLDDDRTGFDALRALETFWQSRPLTIMITASFTNAVREEAAQKGIPVVSKPVEPAEIRALMSHLQKAAAE
ncbi:MAG: hybrid sensor histidine kinase/response regulator, partial [Pseudomonadota bacterium]